MQIVVKRELEQKADVLVLGLFEEDNYIEKVECKGAYVNFFINKSKFNEIILKEILKKKEDYGKINIKKEKIVVEYPSPNTNKPLHLGHVRNMLIGQSISNILTFTGNKVFQVNLNNDRGVHICKSMLAYKLYGNNKKPDKKSDHFVGDFYVLYNKKANENPDLENEIQKMLVKWEKKDKETLRLWKLMNSWALNGFNETYKLFKIKFDRNGNGYKINSEMMCPCNVEQHGSSFRIILPVVFCRLA